MVIKDINIFSQNVHKNNLLTNTILEAQREFNIIFIQEPPWLMIHSIPSFSNKEREDLVGVLVTTLSLSSGCNLGKDLRK